MEYLTLISGHAYLNNFHTKTTEFTIESFNILNNTLYIVDSINGLFLLNIGDIFHP